MKVFSNVIMLLLIIILRSMFLMSYLLSRPHDRLQKVGRPLPLPVCLHLLAYIYTYWIQFIDYGGNLGRTTRLVYYPENHTWTFQFCCRAPTSSNCAWLLTNHIISYFPNKHSSWWRYCCCRFGVHRFTTGVNFDESQNFPNKHSLPLRYCCCSFAVHRFTLSAKFDQSFHFLRIVRFVSCTILYYA